MSQPAPESAPIAIPPRGARCEALGCTKRMSLLTQSVGKCRCGSTFCRLHKDPADHACTHDFKKEHRESLESSLGTTPTRAPKVAPI